jgi:hypothetical protein
MDGVDDINNHLSQTYLSTSCDNEREREQNHVVELCRAYYLGRNDSQTRNIQLALCLGCQNCHCDRPSTISSAVISTDTPLHLSTSQSLERAKDSHRITHILKKRFTGQHRT